MTVHVYYPSADGYAEHFAGGGLNFTDLRNANGNNSNSNNDSLSIRMKSDTVTNIWQYLRSIRLVFDISDLLVTDTVIDGGIQMKVLSVLNELSYNLGSNIYPHNATSPSVSDSDFEDRNGGVALCSTPVLWSSLGINDIAGYGFNSNGLSQIENDKGGLTDFSLSESIYDGGFTTPSWESNKDAILNFHSSDRTGTDEDPKLTIVTEEHSIINTKVLTESEVPHELGEEWKIYNGTSWEIGIEGHLHLGGEDWNKFFDTTP